MEIIEDFQVYGEICCELCDEIIHNHIDCPVCKKEYAATTNYSQLEADDIVECKECDSQFELVKDDKYSYWYDGCKVKVIKRGI